MFDSDVKVIGFTPTFEDDGAAAATQFFADFVVGEDIVVFLIEFLLGERAIIDDDIRATGGRCRWAFRCGFRV